MDNPWRGIWARLRLTLRGEATRGAVAMMALWCGVAEAQEPVVVGTELVLALDSSASVDRKEFQLQLDGLAQAFRDPEVLQAVENLKPLGVAVAVTQWGGPGETRIVLPFEFLGSARDAKAFGFRASLIRRWMRASSTSIATGILDSAALIATNDYEGYRKIIDISGDGRDNSNVDLAAARDAARKAGIVINGLPIMAGDEGLAAYYESSVIVGADAFAEPARDFDDFARAIKEKLLKELRPLGS